MGLLGLLGLKRCAQCGKTRKLSYFALDESDPSGHSDTCVACNSPEAWESVQKLKEELASLPPEERELRFLERGKELGLVKDTAIGGAGDLPPDWQTQLSECDFELARDEFVEFFNFANQQAASRGERVAFRDDFLRRWEAFSERPCYETAVSFVEVGRTSVFSQLKKCCPGGRADEDLGMAIIGFAHECGDQMKRLLQFETAPEKHEAWSHVLEECVYFGFHMVNRIVFSRLVAAKRQAIWDKVVPVTLKTFVDVLFGSLPADEQVKMREDLNACAMDAELHYSRCSNDLGTDLTSDGEPMGPPTMFNTRCLIPALCERLNTVSGGDDGDLGRRGEIFFMVVPAYANAELPRKVIECAASLGIAPT